MEVRAWCSLPNLFTTTIPVGPDVSSESLEILFDLPEAETDHDDIFVGVKVRTVLYHSGEIRIHLLTKLHPHRERERERERER